MKLTKNVILGGAVATTVVAGTITFNTEIAGAVKNNIEALKTKIEAFAQNDEKLVNKYEALRSDAEAKITELKTELEKSNSNQDQLNNEISRLEGEVKKANVAIEALKLYSDVAVQSVANLNPTDASTLPGLDGEIVEEEQIATATSHFYADSVHVTITLNTDINIGVFKKGNIKIQYLDANRNQIQLKDKTWDGYLNNDGKQFGKGLINNNNCSNELEAGKTYSTTLRTSSLNEVAQVVITVVNNEGESITINKLNPNQ